MNFSSVGPSHVLQFFTNCSSTDPFHRMHSFRNGLLQNGAPLVSQVLAENLLLCGLLSMVHSSCQETILAWTLHGVTASYRAHPPLPSWSTVCWVDISSVVVLHGLQGHSLPHHGLLHRLQGNLYFSTWTPPPPPSSLTLMSAGLFLSHILSPLSQQLLPSSFFPSLDMLS